MSGTHSWLLHPEMLPAGNVKGTLERQWGRKKSCDEVEAVGD